MSKGTIIVTKQCLHCKGLTSLLLDKDKYKTWQHGELIQNVWPEWTAEQRELLISGMHGDCWTRVFYGGEDYENN